MHKVLEADRACRWARRSPRRHLAGGILADRRRKKKSGIVEIFLRPGGDALCGRIAWFKIKPDDPNPQGLDLKNPDPARRDQPLCGLIFMYGFQPAEPGSWDGGAVYDPDSGNSYHAIIKLRADGTLDLHGYIGISLLGRSEIWTRYTQPLPSCPTR